MELPGWGTEDWVTPGSCLEYINSARGHLITLENKCARGGYLEETTQGTTKKQKACGTLFSSEMHA